MRILVAMLSVGFAGTERHAVELANELSRQGHDVAMLLRRRPSRPQRQAPYQTLRNAISPRIRVFLASRAVPVVALWRSLMQFRPDIVHAHSERSVRIATRRTGRIPLIATVHQPFRGPCLMRCDGLIYLTEYAADTPSQFPGQVFVIGNWVRPHPRPADAILSARRAEFGLAPDDYVVGTVARVEPEKGIDGLITAFHAAALPASRLMIVGDGVQRTELDRRVAALGLNGRVIFTGFRHDVRDLYFLFDAFVLNSVSESFGLAILEAAAACVPVIATATTGALKIAERLPLELVPTGRPELVASALTKVYQQGTAVYDMSGFSIESTVHSIVEAYRHVLSAKLSGSQRTPKRRFTASMTG